MRRDADCYLNDFLRSNGMAFVGYEEPAAGMEARDFIIQLTGWGWTQQQIAERTEIPQPTISKVARGTVQDVLSRNYRKLQALHDEARASREQPAAPAHAPSPAAQRVA